MSTFTGSTSGFLAAAQANAAVLAYAKEDTYATIPAGAFQKTRFTGESFKPTNTRQRPDEINDLAEASQAVTTQISVSGTLSGALSVGTYDDLLGAVLCNDWAEDGTLRNGKVYKTWSIVEALGEKWFVRPGAVCTSAQLTFSQGSFSQVSFDFTAARQDTADADPASSYLDAPTGTVLDTVGNFGGVTIDGTTPDGCIRTLSIKLDRNGGGADYGNGHADACGVHHGELEASGQIQMFFKTYDVYERYASGKGGPIAVTVNDGTGNGYVMTFLNAVLLNPQINAGSKNTSIMATFDIEGNPAVGGGTFLITKVKPAAPGG